ncbi:MAG: hypothetical protein ER33_05595 [Cyanobium sp. CACIAM 14]|nr:MAG: hypothetical protein ER33_05595 [Cyanobium sp. CACIAM 14]
MDPARSGQPLTLSQLLGAPRPLPAKGMDPHLGRGWSEQHALPRLPFHPLPLATQRIEASLTTTGWPAQPLVESGQRCIADAGG